MKKIFRLLIALCFLTGCSSKTDDNWISVNVWLGEEKVDTIYIKENSSKDIGLSSKRITWSNGTRKETPVYIKEYSILDGFYSADGIKRFDGNGKCLFSSWTKDFPTDVYCRFVSFDEHTFFEYKNNGDPVYRDVIKIVIPDYDVELCKMSPNAYLKIDYSFRGKPSLFTSGHTFKIYDRNDNSKECFYTGEEAFDSPDYEDHHLIFKISTIAAYYGNIFMIWDNDRNAIYCKNEVLKISYSLTDN